MNEVLEMDEILELILIFIPWIINIFLYFLWKYRAKKAMERDGIDYWCQSYVVCKDTMCIFAFLWLPGTVMMILAMICDREY